MTRYTQNDCVFVFQMKETKSSAAFSKASARKRSPTKQYPWRHFLLFSRRTFAGARFAEPSTVLKLVKPYHWQCEHLSVTQPLTSIGTHHQCAWQNTMCAAEESEQSVFVKREIVSDFCLKQTPSLYLQSVVATGEWIEGDLHWYCGTL